MSMKKFVLGACAAALMSTALSGAALARDLLRVGTEPTFAPFEFLDTETKQFAGFDMDLIRAVADKAGYDVEILNMGFDALIPALMTRSIDVIAAGLSITEERAKRVDFTKPYINAGLTVMTTKENAPNIKSVKDLEGKCLCAEIGSSGALVMKRIPNTTIRTFNSAADAFLELNKNGCYAMLNDGPVNRYFLRQPASKSMNLVALDFVVSDDQYGMAVQKGNTKLLNRLDNALDAIKADGTYDKIYEKWFGKPASQAVQTTAKAEKAAN